MPEVPEQTVEICVSDNRSEDGTEQMLIELGGAHPDAIRYRRRDRDLGAMRNIFAAVDLADGDYCWLMSSDDALAPGALELVLDALDDSPGVAGMTVNWATYDEAMTEVAYGEVPEILPPGPRRPIHYTDFEALMRDCGVVLGYLSIHIVRREHWLSEVEGRRELLLEHPIFAQALALGMVARRNPEWIWRPEAVVKNRPNNSAWVRPNALYRYHLDTTRDLTSVWKRLVGRGGTYRALLWKWYRLCLTPSWLVTYKLEAQEDARCDREMLVGLLRALWPLREFWLRALPVLLTPRALLVRFPSLRARLEALDG